MLSATPTLLFAALGLYATADPADAKQKFELVSGALNSDQRLIWGIGVIIVGYVAVWWFSSIDPPTKRQRIVHRLQPYYAMTSGHTKAVTAATTDEDAAKIFDTVEREQLAACQWIEEALGPAAKEKFVSRSMTSGGYEWLWDGQHSVEMVRRRSNALNTLGDRLGNLDQLLNSDKWDQPEISAWQKLHRRLIRNR